MDEGSDIVYMQHTDAYVEVARTSYAVTETCKLASLDGTNGRFCHRHLWQAILGLIPTPISGHEELLEIEVTHDLWVGKWVEHLASYVDCLSLSTVVTGSC